MRQTLMITGYFYISWRIAHFRTASEWGVDVIPVWSWTIFEASHTRARSGPPLEGARERGRFGESNQIGRLVHRDLFPAQVVERHLVAQLILQIRDQQDSSLTRDAEFRWGLCAAREARQAVWQRAH